MAEANRRGQPIRLLVPGAQDRVEEVGEHGRIYHLQAPRSPLNRDYRIIYPSRFLFPGTRLQQILHAERPDLIEISDKYTLHYLGALLRLNLLPAVDFRPVMVGLTHERMDDNFRAYLGRIPFSRQVCSLYMKWLYFPFFDHHIANSEYTAEELRSAAEGQLVPRGIWIRPMGVDLECLSPDRRNRSARLRLLGKFSGVSDRTVLLLYVGRMVPEKNLALLFESFARVCRNSSLDYRLLLAGDGIERERWEETSSREMPGRVKFLGHVKSREDLAELYANADIFVHPNPREPFGIAPLEAMASGLALVAPNVGGVSSYADEQNAWTAEPNVASFWQAIEQAAAKGEVRDRKILRALAAARSFGWRSVASSFLTLCEDLYRARAGTLELPGAAFYSIPEAGRGTSLMHVVSQLAEKSFRLGAKLAMRPQSRPLPNPAEPSESHEKAPV